MKFKTANITAGVDFDGLVLTIKAPAELAANLEIFTGEYEVEIYKARKKRSLNANALLWKCIGSMAEILDASDEEIYLQLLEQYGVKKFIVVRPEAVESVKQLFRAVDKMGGVLVDGKRGVQLRCTVGSSQYDAKQMGRLLTGTISECKKIGAFVPDEQDVGASLNLWEKER